MREAVQLGAAEVEVAVADVVVGESARASGANRATETQEAVTFIVVSVGKEMNVFSLGKLGRGG